MGPRLGRVEYVLGANNKGLTGTRLQWGHA